LLHIYEHIHGPVGPKTAIALCRVVNVQRQLGNSKDAIVSCERALRIERSIYGNKHLELASTLGLLGACYNDAGQHKKALNCFQEQLKIQESTLGKNHPDLELIRDNIVYIKEIM
jgi:tetratricopeptide (TPR) repeat protein